MSKTVLYCTTNLRSCIFTVWRSKNLLETVLSARRSTCLSFTVRRSEKMSLLYDDVRSCLLILLPLNKSTKTPPSHPLCTTISQWDRRNPERKVGHSAWYQKTRRGNGKQITWAVEWLKYQRVLSLYETLPETKFRENHEISVCMVYDFEREDACRTGRLHDFQRKIVQMVNLPE